MDAFMSWAKENFDLITLLVGVACIFIAILSLVDEIRKRKNKKASS